MSWKPDKVMLYPPGSLEFHLSDCHCERCYCQEGEYRFSTPKDFVGFILKARKEEKSE